MKRVRVMTFPPIAAALPPAEEIKRRAAEVLARPEYQQQASEGSGLVQSLLLRALEYLLDAFLALADLFVFLPGFLRYPAAGVLLLVLFYVVFRILRSLARSVQMPERRREARTRARLGESPEELESQARAARDAGRIIEAIRLLFRAGVLSIEHADKRPNRPGTTNRELLRRYRSPLIQAPLRTFVETIDMKWYGGRPTTLDDYTRCSAAYADLRAVIAARAAEAETDTPPLTTGTR